MNRLAAHELDLVIQGPDLPGDAVEAFRVACLAGGVRHGPGVARLSGIRDDPTTRKVIAALASFWKCDAALIDPRLDWSRFKLLAMDMDSTLITVECVDEIAALSGRGAEVAALTDAAMRGEATDYAASLRERVALLAGVDAAILERVYRERVRLSPGAESLVAAARARGLRTLLVSGGFTYFATRLQQRLGLDESVANELEIADGRLTGTVLGAPELDGAIVDGDGKSRAVADACARIGCTAQAAIVIGDGANDLPMMRNAGLSVAYRAKPVVRAQAQLAIDVGPLDAVAAWLG
jgi:phosphoserine phosphatase